MAFTYCYKSDKIMDLKEAQELTKGKLGLRIKEESDGVLIYANAWTLIVDIGKWIKRHESNDS